MSKVTKPKTTEQVLPDDVSETPSGNLSFEEWRMERVPDGKDSAGKDKTRLEKLKIVRKNVRITQAEADTLNSGADAVSSVNPIMYLLSDES